MPFNTKKEIKRFLSYGTLSKTVRHFKTLYETGLCSVYNREFLSWIWTEVVNWMQNSNFKFKKKENPKKKSNIHFKTSTD